MLLIVVVKNFVNNKRVGPRVKICFSFVTFEHTMVVNFKQKHIQIQ